MGSNDLKIVNTKNVNRGLVFRGDEKVPISVRVPRKAALSMAGMESKPVSSCFCQLLCDGYNAQRSSLYWGRNKTIHSDLKYCMMGAQPSHAEPSVCLVTYHMNKMPMDS